MKRVKEEVEKELKYQQYLLDEGRIKDLIKMKDLKPEIKDKIKDVIKQTEWS